MSRAAKALRSPLTYATPQPVAFVFTKEDFTEIRDDTGRRYKFVAGSALKMQVEDFAGAHNLPTVQHVLVVPRIVETVNGTRVSTRAFDLYSPFQNQFPQHLKPAFQGDNK